MEIIGIVVEGKKRARTLGYPTANLAYRAASFVQAGVWVCSVMIEHAQHQGLVIVGMWMIDEITPSVEVFVLDYHGDLYGQTLQVVLLNYLRALKRFSTDQDLKKQIEQDIVQARNFFSHL